MKIGVFGGTFDPPHIAHLILAQEACNQLGLERLLWVLTPNPPHKRGRKMTAAPQRWAMLQLAVQDNPRFVPSRVDIDRPPPQYAVDTLHLLAQAYPKAELVYLIGGDSLRDLPHWHRPLDVVAASAAIGVLHRPRTRIDLKKLEARLPGLSAKIRWIAGPRLDISATHIRRLAGEGKEFRYYLPEAVYTYIRENQLYCPA
ncbi:MAG TPA: nicotinate-nucleotide adenylyltransferase [Anaerolineales bacterium]|nr:nicotinate-nucleotide adenylyltransferase [Anaerolineales bacterium]